MIIDRAELEKLVSDPKRIVDAPDIEEKYLRDSLEKIKGYADVLIFALSTEEVSQILKFANEHKIPVTPRGAGTGLIGAAVPQNGGILLDFSKMNRILELDTETMTITVEPGLLLKDLQSYVEERGLFYPPDPGEKASSIGGNISTNAGGMRAVKYGVTRDYVRGLEIVRADGTILQVGSKNVKDSSGLSLKHLLIGSEGTLAVITKCILRLIPKPEKSVSLIIAYRDLAEGIRSVLQFLQSDVKPTAIEFLERRIVTLGENFLGIQFPCPNAGSYLLLTLDGNDEELHTQVQKTQALSETSGAIECIVLDDPEEYNKIWTLRSTIANAVNELSTEWDPVDIVVPVNRTAEFVNYVNEVETASGMQMFACGHAGDGNVHLWVLRGERDRETWERELHENMDAIYAMAYELGGLTSGEHGIGIAKRRYFLRHTPKENLLLMNQIKDAADPNHILNDEKSYIRR